MATNTLRKADELLCCTSNRSFNWEKTNEYSEEIDNPSLLGCVLVAVLGYVHPASAAPPEEPPSPGFPVELEAGLACSNFDLLIDGFGRNQHLKEFTDKNGNVVRSLVAGKGFELHFTNLTTQETFVTKSNGAVEHTRFNADGSKTVTAMGHNLLILFPTDVPAGPSTMVIVGRVVFTVDINGVFTVLDVNGKTTDICAALS